MLLFSEVKSFALSVADPGFLVGGGHRAVAGGANLRCGCFLAKTCENEKIGSCWGGHAPAAPPLDPPMVMVNVPYFTIPLVFI